MNTEYEIIEGLKAGYEEAYKYIYDRQWGCVIIPPFFFYAGQHIK